MKVKELITILQEFNPDATFNIATDDYFCEIEPNLIYHFSDNDQTIKNTPHVAIDVTPVVEACENKKKNERENT